jgi:hypothetical protein
MRPAARGGGGIIHDLASRWVEPADIAVALVGVPDAAVTRDRRIMREIAGARQHILDNRRRSQPKIGQSNAAGERNGRGEDPEREHHGRLPEVGVVSVRLALTQERRRLSDPGFHNKASEARRATLAFACG